MDSMFILKIISFTVTSCATLFGITIYYAAKIYFLFKKNRKEISLIKQKN